MDEAQDLRDLVRRQEKILQIYRRRLAWDSAHGSDARSMVQTGADLAEAGEVKRAMVDFGSGELERQREWAASREGGE